MFIISFVCVCVFHIKVRLGGVSWGRLDGEIILLVCYFCLLYVFSLGDRIMCLCKSWGRCVFHIKVGVGGVSWGKLDGDILLVCYFCLFVCLFVIFVIFLYFTSL